MPAKPRFPEAPARDQGIDALVIFVVAALLVVGAVVVADAVDQWWVLVPVMVVDFAAAFGVLVTINHLLADDGEPAADAKPPGTRRA